MDKKEKCNLSECCKTHWYRILGVILLVLAAILTIVTYSGLGILGMFVAGLMLCCHKHISSKMGLCGCGCSCCDSSSASMCDMGDKAEKKTAIKKSSI